MSRHKEQWAGRFLAALGVLIVLAELTLHFVGAISHYQYEINHVALLMGAVVGFVGFYIMDPKRTGDGAVVLVDSTVKVIGAVRGGRRKTDPQVIPDSSAMPAHPDEGDTPA